MSQDISHRKMALKELCNSIVLQFPDAMCMAVIELDCGCVNACGVSVSGRPVGRLKTYTGAFEDRSGGPICIKCAGTDSPIKDRIVHRELVWPGDDREKPDRELRNLIGREVFGPAYEEPE